MSFLRQFFSEGKPVGVRPRGRLGQHDQPAALSVFRRGGTVETEELRLPFVDVPLMPRAVIARALETDGDAALFAHGHILRILAACWLGIAPDSARFFALGTAGISTLGYEHETRVILRWNLQ